MKRLILAALALFILAAGFYAAHSPSRERAKGAEGKGAFRLTVPPKEETKRAEKVKSFKMIIDKHDQIRFISPRQIRAVTGE